jgi:hypothetical protein
LEIGFDEDRCLRERRLLRGFEALMAQVRLPAIAGATNNDDQTAISGSAKTGLLMRPNV